MTVNFAVLGTGRIGQVHARAISQVEDASLVAVYDVFDQSARAVATQHHCEVWDIERIESDQSIDAVVICSPTDTHADLIETFCRAGKAVFCEKPIDLDLQRVLQTLKIVEQTNGKLMVGFQRRFDPDFQALKQVIDNGEVGDPEMIALTSRDPSPPPYDYIKRSGGIFRDMTIHDFDVARWLLGEEVETVQAAASVLVDSEIGNLGDYDSVNILLTTAGGRQCTINNSRRASYGYDQRIEVHGSKGSVTALNHHRTALQVASEHGYTRPPLQDFFMTRYQTAYAAEIAAFVQALKDQSVMPTTGEDGLRALALADAAKLSVLEERRVYVKELLG